MIGKRKKLLQDMADAMALEVREPLKPLGATAVDEGVKDLKQELQASALKQDANWYNTDANFEAAVKSAMVAKRNVLADAERLPMDAPSVDLTGWSLAEPGRVAKLASWLQAGPAATTLSIQKCSLGAEGAELLAPCIAGCASLTSISLLGNKFDDETASMLLKVKEEKPTLLTLCGLKPDQTLADFQGWDMGPAGAKLLAPELAVHTSLTSLR